jgi:hypothetical protein
MSAGLSFTQMAGVVACIVGDAAGRVLEETSAGPNHSELIGAAAALAEASGNIGVLLGLGDFEIVTTKAASHAWVIGSHDEWSVAVKVDGSRPTTPIETAVRNAEWFSLVEWDVNTSEIECVPVADGASDKAKTALRAAGASKPSPSAAPESTGEESGLKLRAAPKYQRVLMRGGGDANDFPLREAPTSPFPSNAMLSAGTVPAPADGLGNAPIFAGDLRMFGLVDLIEFLGNARRTGSLTCASKERKAKVQMRFGKIVSASCPPVRGLREYLAARILGGSVLPAQTGVAHEIWAQPDAAVNVVKLGLASASQVRAALDEQLRDVLGELMTWTEGEFSFETERPGHPSPLDLELEFDSQALLLDVLRAKDERAVGFARRS